MIILPRVAEVTQLFSTKGRCGPRSTTRRDAAQRKDPLALRCFCFDRTCVLARFTLIGARTGWERVDTRRPARKPAHVLECRLPILVNNARVERLASPPFCPLQ